MYKQLFSIVAIAIVSTLVLVASGICQERNGAIAGSVKDAQGGVLPGARIVLQPKNRSISSNAQGEFTLPDLPSGSYNLTVSYVGFSPFSTTVIVNAGQVSHLDAILQIGTQT